MKSYVAIIPARKGSKRLRDKNNLVFYNAKSIVELAIEEAIASNKFSKILLTTDDEKVIEKCKRFQDHIIIINRPKNLATDKASSVAVVLHAISKLKFNTDPGTSIVLLQPTSPLRTKEHIRSAIALYEQGEKKSLISFTIPNNFTSKHIIEHLGKKIQLNGAIYIRNLFDFNLKPSFCVENSILFEMSQDDSIDIDTLDDFKLAQTLFKARR